MSNETQRLTGRADPAAVQAVRSALAARFGNRASTSPSLMQQHTNTVTWVASQPPDVVVFPQIDRGGRVRSSSCARSTWSR